jgi:hypothetical protein
VARGKLELRTKTFSGNSLCRGADELCTKQLEARCLLFAELKATKDAFMTSDSENPELHRENIGLKTEINRLQKENGKLDILLDCYMEEERVAVATCEQRNSVLMHYNELQSRSAEVEAMAMTFE